MANSADTEQTASWRSSLLRATLFAYSILSGTLLYEILGHLPYIMIVPLTVCQLGELCSSTARLAVWTAVFGCFGC